MNSYSPIGLYSDPYLKLLINEKPELANEFFNAISESKFSDESSVVDCLEIPGWLLEKAIYVEEINGYRSIKGLRSIVNPNFPLSAFENVLNNDEFVQEGIRYILKYPNLNQSHINQLLNHKNLDVQCMALAHPFNDNSKLIKFIQKNISDIEQNTLVNISNSITLSDEVFNLLFNLKNPDEDEIKNALWSNPSLSEAQKTMLVLSNFSPSDSRQYAFMTFAYISSIAYYQFFEVDFSEYESKFIDSVKSLNPEIEKYFSSVGHPLSVFSSTKSFKEIEYSRTGLNEIISRQFLNRLFWTELCEREDFKIDRRNAYRTDNVCVSHPIIGRDFELADAEESHDVGGVFMFNDQKWLIGSSELSPESAANSLTAAEESIAEILENYRNVEFNELGEILIALTLENSDMSKKYGFEIKEEAIKWMVDTAKYYTESDYFDVFAELNPEFEEKLSWRKLSEEKKNYIFNFLELGISYPEFKNDCIHFLACMALHEDTPSELLKKLKNINLPLVNEVLISRS